ncbi:MAG: hypothetical protein LBR80_06410 [Deltaproteobacteria bacterium]|nr:hypothetical protein [Deltaproteobacteria bacterium]
MIQKRLVASLVFPILSDCRRTLFMLFQVTVSGSQRPGSLIQAADRSRPVPMMSGSLL